MNVLTENRVNRQTGQVEKAVTHVGCAHCGRAIPVTALHYWRALPNGGAIEYYCSAEHSLAVHNARTAQEEFIASAHTDRRITNADRRSGKGHGMRRSIQRRQG